MAGRPAGTRTLAWAAAIVIGVIVAAVYLPPLAALLKLQPFRHRLGSRRRHRRPTALWSDSLKHRYRT